MARRRKPISGIDDPRYLKALSHPMRVRILALLADAPGSPKQLAQRLDASLGVVAYHVRTLHELDLLKLVGTRQRRGATEHLYRAVEHPRFVDAAWESMDPVAKQRLLGASLRQIGEYANASAAAGGFDRADAHVSRRSLKLDDAGWRQLAAASRKWLAEIDRIEAAASHRAEADGAAARADVGVVTMLFEAVPLADAAAARDGA